MLSHWFMKTSTQKLLKWINFFLNVHFYFTRRLHCTFRLIDIILLLSRWLIIETRTQKNKNCILLLPVAVVHLSPTGMTSRKHRNIIVVPGANYPLHDVLWQYPICYYKPIVIKGNYYHYTAIILCNQNDTLFMWSIKVERNWSVISHNGDRVASPFPAWIYLYINHEGVEVDMINTKELLTPTRPSKVTPNLTSSLVAQSWKSKHGMRHRLKTRKSIQKNWFGKQK